MSRKIWADVAKGVAILLVVINHTGNGILTAGIGNCSEIWVNFYNFCYIFMVPVFFLISGWFAQLSSKNTKQRLSSLLSNLVYPYLIWSTAQASIMIVSKAGNIVPNWSDLSGILFGGWMQFWFLHCLTLVMLLDIFFRAFKISFHIRMCIAVILTAMSILNFDFLRQLGDVASHILYFEVGIILAMVHPLLKKYLNIYSIFVSSLVLLLTFHVAGAGHGEPLRVIGAFVGISFCIALAAIIAKVPIIRSLFSYLGYYSLQIYMLHVIFAAGLRVFMMKFGIESFSLHLVIGTLGGIFAPLLVGIMSLKFGIPLFRFGKGVKASS